jgi:hypothetical protein
MAYIGNTPAESYASFEKQVFTIVNSQTAYTLNHSVVNENDIRLVVNNVVQEPGSGKAYTASGTTLTLSAALVNGTDEMYCVFLGRALQTVNPPNASVGTAQLASTSVTAAKLNNDIISGTTALGATPADTDELLISDAGTLKRVDYSYLKSANTPAFMATASAQLTLTNGTNTKVEFNTEVVDTDNCYDNSTNYRFTPTTAGKHNISYFASMETTGGVGSANFAFFKLYKNGSVIHQAYIDSSNNNTYAYAGGVTAIVDMNGSSDYLEAFVFANASSGNMKVQNSTYTMFSGYKLIGV